MGDVRIDGNFASEMLLDVAMLDGVGGVVGDDLEEAFGGSVGVELWGVEMLYL